jgi:hypothetical protein
VLGRPKCIQQSNLAEYFSKIHFNIIRRFRRCFGIESEVCKTAKEGNGPYVYSLLHCRSDVALATRLTSPELSNMPKSFVSLS